MAFMIKRLYEELYFGDNYNTEYIVRSARDIDALHEMGALKRVCNYSLADLAGIRYSYDKDSFESFKYLPHFNYHGGIRTPVNIKMNDLEIPIEDTLVSIRLVDKVTKTILDNPSYWDKSTRRFDDWDIITNMFDKSVLHDANHLKLTFEVDGCLPEDEDYENFLDKLRVCEFSTSRGFVYQKVNLNNKGYYRIIDSPDTNELITQLDELRSNATKKLDEHLQNIINQASTLKTALESLQINSIKDFDTLTNYPCIRHRGDTGELIVEGRIRAWKELTPDIDLEFELIIEEKTIYKREIEKHGKWAQAFKEFEDLMIDAGLDYEHTKASEPVYKNISDMPINIDITFTHFNKDALYEQVEEHVEDLKYIKNQIIDEYQTYVNHRLSSIIDERKVDADAFEIGSSFSPTISVTEIED